jgi:hypothetical protein
VDRAARGAATRGCHAFAAGRRGVGPIRDPTLDLSRLAAPAARRRLRGRPPQRQLARPLHGCRACLRTGRGAQPSAGGRPLGGPPDRECSSARHGAPPAEGPTGGERTQRAITPSRRHRKGRRYPRHQPSPHIPRQRRSAPGQAGREDDGGGRATADLRPARSRAPATPQPWPARPEGAPSRPSPTHRRAAAHQLRLGARPPRLLRRLRHPAARAERDRRGLRGRRAMEARKAHRGARQLEPSSPA